MKDVIAASGGDNFKSLATPLKVDEVIAASGGEVFKHRAKPFPITGPKHFHPSRSPLQTTHANTLTITMMTQIATRLWKESNTFQHLVHR